MAVTSDFLNAYYQGNLGRAPDQAAIDYYNANPNLTTTDLLNNITGSQEFGQRTQAQFANTAQQMQGYTLTPTGFQHSGGQPQVNQSGTTTTLQNIPNLNLNQTQSNVANNPYASNLQNMVNGQFSPTDPSYQWRYDQGLNALQNQLARAGQTGSGNALVAAQQYGQGLASTEYQNQFNRTGTAYGLAQNTANSAASNALGIGTLGLNQTAQTQANDLAKQSMGLQQQKFDWTKSYQQSQMDLQKKLAAASGLGYLTSLYGNTAKSGLPAILRDVYGSLSGMLKDGGTTQADMLNTQIPGGDTTGWTTGDPVVYADGLLP